jgi:hypothetical protein
MSWAERDVYGSETFYRGPVFRSAFFVADSIMLLLASAMTLYVLVRYMGILSGPGILGLFGALLGMWLLWWKAMASHKQMHALYSSGFIQEGEGISKSPMEAIMRTTASLTHLGMFTTFLLVAMLLMLIGETLRRVVH